MLHAERTSKFLLKVSERVLSYMQCVGDTRYRLYSSMQHWIKFDTLNGEFRHNTSDFYTINTDISLLRRIRAQMVVLRAQSPYKHENESRRPLTVVRVI